MKMAGTPAAETLHIGIVLPSLKGGGAERIMLTLAKSLIERGHRIDLVLERCAGDYLADLPKDMGLYYTRTRLWKADPELLRHCRERGITAQALPINPLGAARAWLALRRKRLGVPVKRRYALYAYGIARYIRAAQPQLLLSALLPANAPALYATELMGHSLPAVVSVHNNAGLSYTENQLATARVLYPRADAVVAVSKGAGSEVSGLLGVPAARVHTVYNPISSSDIWRLAQEEVAHPWFRDGEPPVILNVGRETAAKDYPTLVEAFGLVRRQLRVRLVILGHFSASYRAGLIAQAQSHGGERDLAFVDFDQHPFRYMRRARLFALSSRWEGLPTVLLEALACGTPVVSTATPYGLSEILDGGRWGKLVPVGDAPALGQAMVETLQGDRLAEEVLRRRAADFSCERAAGAYTALFEQLMRN